MPLNISKQTLLKYDVAGPRYTSYPTAPEWSTAVSVDIYSSKLIAFGQNDKTLSLYVHIPFCEQLCYFCACNKVIRKKEDTAADEYLKFLFLEIDLIVKRIGQRKRIKQLHWGGGTPTFLNEIQIQTLFNKISSVFEIDPDAEIAIEIDPRTVTDAKLTVLRQLGFNRVSMGVQDFDEKVQDDINRIQPFEQVKAVNDYCRRLGFSSINFDLIYGLPYQTRATFERTVDQVIGLKPDRIALYSFAYVPWLSKPQNKFNLKAIALHDEKIDIFVRSRQQLIDNGYQSIAMDHFALKTDEMSKAFNAGTLHRNFMGYTVKPADEYIGLGVSAIGFVENTYVQNVKVLSEYYLGLTNSQLPIERGKELSTDDILRQGIINALMCQFNVDKQKFMIDSGYEFNVYFKEEQEHLQQCLEDGLIIEDRNSIKVTDLGKMFIRNVCMGFDWYLRQKDGHKRFSRTV